MADADPDFREVRLAVVMTGGVSLAVWIGGVVGEIYRASRGEGIYGALCATTRSRVTIDVITGASAGGVNGAFLASAVAYQPPTDLFDTLRDVWLQDGSFDSLLRKPSELHPPSLLQGDAYFLKRLVAVLGEWTNEDKGDNTAEPGELTLVMTTTTLTPDLRAYVDDLGVRLVEPVHRAQFMFRDIDFGGERTLLARQLALAARSTASFPGAFEPAFVPIGLSVPSPAGKGAPELVDMKGVASFSTSRWVIDGGVLVNKPVAAAIDAVKRRSADREVRRVMLYVNPDPAEIPPAEQRISDQIDRVPPVAQVVAKSLVSLPRTESISADLQEIRRLNRQVLRQRDTRAALLLGVHVRDSGVGDDPDFVGDWRVERPDLVDLARRLYPLWLRERSYASVVRRLTASDRYEPGALLGSSGGTWAEFAQELRYARGAAGWLASELPQLYSDPEPVRPHDPTEATHLDTVGEWRVGLDPLEYIGSLMLDLVRRAYRAVPLTAKPGGDDADVRALRERLGAVRGVVHAQRKLIALLRFVDDEFWQTELNRPWPDEALNVRAKTLFDAWPFPSVALNTDSISTPISVRADQWCQVRALFGAAAEMPWDLGGPDLGVWDATTDAVLNTTRITDELPDRDTLEAGLPSDRGARAPSWRAYHRAEAVIARRLVQVLVDSADVLYEACDHALGPGWRAAVVDSAILEDKSDAFDRPHVPGLTTEADRRPSPEAAVLAAMTVRLTWRSPQPARTSGPGGVGIRPSLVPRTAGQVLQQLLGLYVVHTFADRGLDESEVRIELLQLSADNPTPLSPGIDATGKVAGLQLGHFGGFLKRSWRANDWMWGALDAAHRLTGMLTDPERLRQRFASADHATAALCAIAAGRSPDKVRLSEPTEAADDDRIDPSLSDDDLAHLSSIVTDDRRKAMRVELGFLDTGGQPRGHMEVTRTVLGHTAQLLAARRELISVAMSLKATQRDRAAESARASEFYVEMSPYLPGGPGADPPIPLPLSKVAALVRKMPVASERVAGEFGSDRFTATAAQAAAVAGNLIGGKGLGLGVLQRPLTAARYGLRGLSAIADSTLTETRTQSGFRNILLAIGGVVLAASLVGVRMPGALLVTACIAIAGWLALTALGSSLRRAVVWAPLVLVALLAALTFLERDDAQRTFTERHGEQGWKVPALIAGLLAAVTGFVVEIVRHRVAERARERHAELDRPTRRSHRAHALVWLAVGAAWYGLWYVFFNGNYDGNRKWFVDRAVDIREVRYLLLIAVPAALVGVDLVARWVAETSAQRQRNRETRRRQS